ncbi:MAG TPA: LytR C-terminal domain-containing protein [Actinotalea sp.]|nr:LytR C-terminal domain-containing protein [Actinotalea sp.]
MSPADYPYPPDEFDGAAASAGPRGVHRTPRTWWSRWWPFVAAVVLAPVLAYAAVTVVSDGVDLPWQGSDTATEEETPAEEATEDAAEPTEEATEEPGASPEPAPEPTPEAVVDLARAVEVFNSTTTAGLASAAQDAVEAAGFTDVSSGNWDGDDQAATVVYYPAAADVATAQAVAAALGIAAVEESVDLAPEGIVVVLADDFTP